MEGHCRDVPLFARCLDHPLSSRTDPPRFITFLMSRGDSENGKRRETRGRTEERNRREGHTDQEVCGWVGGFKVGKVRREKGVYECEVKVHQKGSPSARDKSKTCPILFRPESVV